jgi:hypothetical protein
MQARFHRNIAASSLAADCNVPQRPPAVIRSFYIYSDGTRTQKHKQKKKMMKNAHKRIYVSKVQVAIFRGVVFFAVCSAVLFLGALSCQHITHSEPPRDMSTGDWSSWSSCCMAM